MCVVSSTEIRLKKMIISSTELHEYSGWQHPEGGYSRV